MAINKVLLAASAVTSLFAAAAGNAAVVGSNAATTGTGASSFASGTPVNSTALTGTATLDDSGSYSATSHGTASVTGFGTVSLTSTEEYTGTYGSGTFTPSAGSITITSCTGSKVVCAGAANPPTSTFDAVGGSLTLAGGTLTGHSTKAASGTVPTVDSTYTFVVGAFTPVSTSSGGSSSGGSTVPLPPAVWLLGSGLLGLVGTARRRKA